MRKQDQNQDQKQKREQELRQVVVAEAAELLKMEVEEAVVVEAVQPEHLTFPASVEVAEEGPMGQNHPVNP